MSGRQNISHERTLELIKLAQEGDDDALSLLCEDNMPLVHVVAGKYRCSMDYDDLVQTGSLGLLRAIKRFDASYGVRFSTYAVPMIAGEIKRALRDDGQLKVSRSIRELAQRVVQIREELTSETGRDPSVEEIAERAGCSPYDIAECIEAMRPCVSIYEPIFEDDSEATIADRIADDEGSFEDSVIDDLFLRDALSRLPDRERRLINLRYFHNMTQRQTAQVLGISQVQVSRLESKILDKMRKMASV